MDIAFTSELETIFREAFLKAASLYQEASKIKLPVEDKIATLYRGALSDETRTVEEVADWLPFDSKKPYSEETAREFVRDLALRAGHVVDGLIRLENLRALKDNDPRNTSNLRVTDIFEFADGRRNLVLFLVKNWSTVSEPDSSILGWVAYRFRFAAASIKMEYKASSVAAQAS